MEFLSGLVNESGCFVAKHIFQAEESQRLSPTEWKLMQKVRCVRITESRRSSPAVNTRYPKEVATALSALWEGKRYPMEGFHRLSRLIWCCSRVDHGAALTRRVTVQYAP
ncbi:hypothetical protein EVAR_61428_1 [Eumeta japonica]|uniref:Uncharacterized protein n=1 Tax=Eumeta variegata TaxID=151549 RepID=A0A4C1Y582_EUMVA|nr:hypothetical protein EVAR_61428_1 [Eumeta japonica]